MNMADKALLQINTETLEGLARADPDLGPEFVIAEFLETRDKPAWLPGKTKKINNISKRNPEYHTMREAWTAALETALLQHKAAVRATMSATALKKITRASRAVQLRTLQHAGLPVKVLLTIFWHKSTISRPFFPYLLCCPIHQSPL